MIEKTPERETMEFAIEAVISLINEVTSNDEDFEKAQASYFPQFVDLLNDQGKALFKEVIESLQTRAEMIRAASGVSV
ncbi:MAG: hypothetical protein KKB59_14290 [Spirochaetes bacterium]|nr:hypothetical protein [Spirochaetota bacterium]